MDDLFDEFEEVIADDTVKDEAVDQPTGGDDGGHAFCADSSKPDDTGATSAHAASAAGGDSAKNMVVEGYLPGYGPVPSTPPPSYEEAMLMKQALQEAAHTHSGTRNNDGNVFGEQHWSDDEAEAEKRARGGGAGPPAVAPPRVSQIDLSKPDEWEQVVMEKKGYGVLISEITPSMEMDDVVAVAAALGRVVDYKAGRCILLRRKGLAFVSFKEKDAEKRALHLQAFEEDGKKYRVQSRKHVFGRQMHDAGGHSSVLNLGRASDEVITIPGIKHQPRIPAPVVEKNQLNDTTGYLNPASYSAEQHQQQQQQQHQQHAHYNARHPPHVTQRDVTPLSFSSSESSSGTDDSDKRRRKRRRKREKKEMKKERREWEKRRARHDAQQQQQQPPAPQPYFDPYSGQMVFPPPHHHHHRPHPAYGGMPGHGGWYDQQGGFAGRGGGGGGGYTPGPGRGGEEEETFLLEGERGRSHQCRRCRTTLKKNYPKRCPECSALLRRDDSRDDKRDDKRERSRDKRERGDSTRYGKEIGEGRGRGGENIRKMT